MDLFIYPGVAYILYVVVVVYILYLVKKKTNKKKLKVKKVKKEDILNKIKSNYILSNIFEYINKENFKLKFFVHSKLYQKKFNLQLSDFMINYFLINGINDFEECFISSGFLDDFYYLREDNNLLKDLSLFEKYIIAYFKKYKNNLLKKYSDKNIEIDLFSPYLPIFCKTELFEQIFIVVVMPKNISDAFNLINETNKAKNKITSIKIKFNRNEDISQIKKLKISKYIKRLAIYEQEYRYGIDDVLDVFYGHNLTYLDLKIYHKINPKYINHINNLKCLEILIIEDLTRYKVEFVII